MIEIGYNGNGSFRPIQHFFNFNLGTQYVLYVIIILLYIGLVKHACNMLIIVPHTLPYLSNIVDYDWLSVTYIYHFFSTTHSLPRKIIPSKKKIPRKIIVTKCVKIQISKSMHLFNKEIFLLLFSCGISYTPKRTLGLK